MTWTPFCERASHLQGLPQGWQITLELVGPYSARVYMLNKYNGATFNPLRDVLRSAFTLHDSIEEARRIGEEWLAELLQQGEP